MALMTSLLMVALAVLSLTNTDGFSISRTGPHLTSGPRQNPDLKDAVRILQRQRRRVREEEYIDPRSAMLLSRGDLDDLWAARQDVRPDQLWLSQALEFGPYADAYPEDFADEPSFRGPLLQHKEVEPSDEELDDIFRKDDDDDEKEDNKIIVPAKEAAKIAALAAAEEEDSEKKKKSEKKSSPSSSLEAKANGEGDSVTLSKEEFRALMSAVKKLEKEISADDAKGAIVAASSSPAHKEPVSQEELAQVFEAAEQDDGDHATQDSKGEIEVIDETLPDTAKPILDNAALQSAVTALANQGALQKSSKELSQMDKFLLLKSIYDQQQQEDDDKRKKRAPMKRSGMAMPKVQEEGEARDYDGLTVEIANLVKEIETLRYLAKLEDMENDALTEALNEATIAQIEGVVSPREAKAIQRAIHIEEALNQLPIRDEISGPAYLQGITTDVTGDDVEDDEEDDVDLKNKRGEPVWRKREEDEDEEEEEEEKERALQAFQDDLGTWYNQPLAGVPSPDRSLDDQEERDRLIWELSKQLAPAEEKELDEDSKVCPAVAALSTNCQFADDYNLPIDNEARELCNRHQICYACGGSFSISPEVCDGGFRSEADRLCGDDSTCQVEAELFLRALQLKHAFQQHQLPICQQTACAAEYVGLV